VASQRPIREGIRAFLEGRAATEAVRFECIPRGDCDVVLIVDVLPSQRHKELLRIEAIGIGDLRARRRWFIDPDGARRRPRRGRECVVLPRVAERRIEARNPS
jgi:hypothetical protein